MSSLLEQLNKTYFWDIDPNFLDELKSKKIIIERVMNFGNLIEIQLVRKYYGEKEIKKTVCDLSYIDPKTLNFISMFLKIPKTKFKCYTRKQFLNQHWSY
jgi:hypothetical protein